MADNYVENHQLEFEAQKAKKEKERKKRLHRYLVAYRKKLEQKSSSRKTTTNNYFPHAAHSALCRNNTAQA